MTAIPASRQSEPPGPPRAAEDVYAVARQILSLASQGPPRISFLREVSRMLLDHTRCEALEVRLSDDGLCYRWCAWASPQRAAVFELLRPPGRCGAPLAADAPDKARWAWIADHLLFDRSAAPAWRATRHGSQWMNADDDRWVLPETLRARAGFAELRPGRPGRSRALIPFVVGETTNGLLLLEHEGGAHFDERVVESCETVAQMLGMAVASRRAQERLRERVKEMTCLYGMARVVQRNGASVERTLAEIVDLLPPAWQFPALAEARITLDGRSYRTRRFEETARRQAAPIVVEGRERGRVEVVYVGEHEEFAGGAFLPEEQSLLESVAREVSQIVERAAAQEEKARLQEQLRHAARLATIGQLAAGVAHEINEPLNAVIGFAQLVSKSGGLGETAVRDVDQIVQAALHAREVIRKLLLFARQTPPKRGPVDLNQLIRDGLYFLEARCAKHAITLERKLDPALPSLTADAAQLQQVLINLVVNAIHAMPEGGTLTVATEAQGEAVRLTVADSGVGMSDEVSRRVFEPFFTTKDVGEGTGLGLAVVQGIVAAHGGRIRVDSREGEGSRFEVELPLRAPTAPGEADAFVNI